MWSGSLQRAGLKQKLMSCVAVGAMIANSMTPIAAAAHDSRTPIKHVIIIIGENRTFDHVFATYQPVSKDEKVLNLLTKKIVNADGTPGPNYGDAVQSQASDTTSYEISPPDQTPYATLPPALTGGPSTPYVCQTLGVTTGTACNTPDNVTAARRWKTVWRATTTNTC